VKYSIVSDLKALHLCVFHSGRDDSSQSSLLASRQWRDYPVENPEKKQSISEDLKQDSLWMKQCQKFSLIHIKIMFYYIIYVTNLVLLGYVLMKLIKIALL
jgi:hypothetical protein